MRRVIWVFSANTVWLVRAGGKPGIMQAWRVSLLRFITEIEKIRSNANKKKKQRYE